MTIAYATRAPSKKSAARKKKLAPVCTTKDLKKKPSKRRKCRVVKPKRTVPTPTPKPTPRVASPTGPVAAPPATSSSPDAFPTATPSPPTPVATLPPVTDGLRTYDGAFGVREAQRLLLRAGFGPKPGQSEALAALGLEAAIDALVNPGAPRLEGPVPTGSYLVGGAFAPSDKQGHLHLSWLDRAIRSTDSLTERMTLVLHDWFGVGQSGAGMRVVEHIDLLRASWRGSFRQLLLDVTIDPAMLHFLDGKDNRKDAPNENYGRELMELYALGADRGAYTERDVRELARCLTGFRQVDETYILDPTLHDTGVKTVFAGTASQRSGNMDWKDAVNAVVDHSLHPSFVVRKLWSYFIPTEPGPKTQSELEALYRSGGEKLEPLVRAILLHPDLHAGAAMTKPPVVLNASVLRAVNRGVDTDAWSFRSEQAGQLLGHPPNVSGWNDRGWLNSFTHSTRWQLAIECLRPSLATTASYRDKTESPEDALNAALAALGNPVLGDDHLALLKRVARTTWVVGAVGDPYGSLATFLSQRQNVLRQLIVTAPDFQVS